MEKREKRKEKRRRAEGEGREEDAEKKLREPRIQTTR